MSPKTKMFLFAHSAVEGLALRFETLRPKA